MRLLYCIGGLANSGGLERVLTTKVNYLVDIAGFDVHIVVGTKLQKTFFPLSSKVVLHYIGDCSNREFHNKLKSLLYEVRPDVSISISGCAQSFLYKIKDGSAKVVEFHFTRNYLVHLVRSLPNLKFRYLHLLKSYYLQYCNDRDFKHYDRVVLLTKQDLDIWGNRDNMCYIPNPVSFRSQYKSDLSQKSIIAVGRLISQKGFDLLVEAFSKIAPNFRDWKLNIFGSGQDLGMLTDMVNMYGLSSQIEIHNPTQEITSEMLKSSVFVFPSRYEGFGLVLTEAMECGLPCIAFDCECGPSEIISHNQTGLLVEAKNVGKLSDAMSRLMGCEQLRFDMGSVASHEVERFYCENIMSKWIDLFNDLYKKL